MIALLGYHKNAVSYVSHTLSNMFCFVIQLPIILMENISGRRIFVRFGNSLPTKEELTEVFSKHGKLQGSCTAELKYFLFLFNFYKIT